MSSEPREPKEGRFARHLRVAGDVAKEPKSLLTLIRCWILDVWVSKGGGFYGLGYVVVLIVLEVRAFTSDIGSSDSVMGFVGGQIVGYLVRVSIQSLVNVIQALIWPIHVFFWLGIWSIPVLVAGYWVFNSVVRPTVETWYPELREARIERASKRIKRKDAN